MKASNLGRDVSRGSCVKKALHSRIFIVGYLQFVETKHLHASLCSTVYGTSILARKVYRRMSLSGIATRLANGSVKPSGSSQRDGSDM
jgi:hypothetical protein